MNYPSDLTDDQWADIEPILLERENAKRYLGGRKRKLDLRVVMNAIFYLMRTGCQWRYIPHDFPNWTTVRYYFDKWSHDGTFQQMNDEIRELVRVHDGRNPEPTAMCIDSQSTKTTESGGERGYDGGKKNNGSQASYRG